MNELTKKRKEKKMSTEKTYEISHFATVTVRADGSGTIDGSLIDDEERPEDWKADPFHVAVDTLFSAALYHALSGIDVGSEAYCRGFEHAMQEISEEYGEE